MIELENVEYRVKKIGNRDMPEMFNQEDMFDFTGMVVGGKIRIGRPLILDIPYSSFNTSVIKSVYQHGVDGDNDKLILPTDFPVASDLDIPPLLKGDLLLGTMNSVYLLRAADLDYEEENKALEEMNKVNEIVLTNEEE